MLGAFETVIDRVTTLAGLLVEVPGLVAVILHIPALRIFTVWLFTTEQTLGVAEIAVVTPALWVMFNAISGAPNTTFVRAGKLMVVVGIVTASAWIVVPNPASRATDKPRKRLQIDFIISSLGVYKTKKAWILVPFRSLSE
ncbi:MAG: hypothetical protein ACKOFA_05605 [Rhodoluna sp.]